MRFSILLICASLILLDFSLPTSINADDRFQYDNERAEVRFDWQMIGNKRKPMSPQAKQKFREELEGELRQDMNRLSERVHDSGVLAAVRASNKEHFETTYGKILEIDQQWKSAQNTDRFVSDLTDEECNQLLKGFQSKYREFAEIFVTNERGLNVCQTNLTTDYYQADENWWVQAFSHPEGAPTHGNLEYDKSAATYAISVYVPIVDPKSKKTIGLTKGVVRRNIGSTG